VTQPTSDNQPETLGVLQFADVYVPRPSAVAGALKALRATLRTLPGQDQRIDLIVCCGASSERDDQSGQMTLLTELAAMLQESDADGNAPVTVCVPGDGDLIRTSQTLSLVLHKLWDDIADRFWSQEAEDELLHVLQAFDSWSTWAREVGAREAINGQTGLLPGDWSATLRRGTRSIGLLAANTCFRRLHPDAAGDSGVLARTQLDLACGGDASAWVAGHDLILLLTFDPWAALDEPSRRTLRDLFAGTGSPPLLHLSAGGERPVTLRRPQDAPLMASAALPLQFDVLPGGTTGLSMLNCSLGPRPLVRLRPWELESIGDHEFRFVPRTNYREDLTPLLQRAANPAAHTKRASKDATKNGDDAGERRLDEDLRTGGTVLLLASSLASLLRTANGQPLARPTDLQLRLLELLGSADAHDMMMPLGELLEQAAIGHQSDVRGVLRDCFTLSEDPLPDEVAWLYSGPWEAVYELQVVPIAERLVQEGLLKDTEIVGGDDDLVPKAQDKLQIVRLNGNVATGDVRFGLPDANATGTARHGWHMRLTADVLPHPTVVVADNFEDYDLWDYLKLWRPDPGIDQRDRPDYGRYLVCPSISTSARQLLQTFGVHCVTNNAADFVRAFLRPDRKPVEEGRKVLARRRSYQDSPRGVRLVSGILRSVSRGRPEFLRGEEPQWGDIIDNVAATLGINQRLRKEVRIKEGEREIIIVRGRAGSGKSSSLMRLAVQLRDEGREVAWVDRTIELSTAAIEREIDRLKPDVVMVDGAELFGSQAHRFLLNLHQEGARAVVAAIRGYRYETIFAVGQDHRVFSHDFDLDDEDITKLIDTLLRHDIRGFLQRYKTHRARLDAFRDRSKRELLVGMMEVTSGKRFEQLITEEYDGLEPPQRLVYGTLAVVTASFESYAISDSELLEILQESQQVHQAAMERLVRHRLVTRTPYRTLHVYHRLVAERLVEHLKKQDPDQLVKIVSRLLRYYASTAAHISDPNNRHRRSMLDLLRHTNMRKLGLPADKVDSIYASARDYLDDDFHFWLQRGEYQLEVDEFDRADDWLRTAANSPGGADSEYVATSYGSLVLRRSATQGGDAQEALLAVRNLDRIARRTRERSPQTFAVLARDGSKWLETHPKLTGSEREEAVRTIEGIIKLGEQLCSNNGQFMNAANGAKRRLREMDWANRGLTPYPLPTSD
jgi:hypothetical protein